MKRAGIALASVLALFLAVCAAIGPFHPDRSYVAYRYAENFAAGQGPAYNPGDPPSQGYGNTLWVLLAALAAKLGFVLPSIGWLLSLACGAAALIILWSELRARSGSFAAWTLCGLVATSGPLAIAAMSGEGAALTALLAVWLVVLIERAVESRTRWIAAGMVGALLAMCAHPFALVFPVLLVLRVRGSRGDTAVRTGALIGSMAFLAALALFHAWRWRTFETLGAHTPGFENERASFGDLFVSQSYDMVPFGAFYALAFTAAMTGVAVSRARAKSWVALGGAIAIGWVTLSTRDPLPGLAGSAALVPLLAISMAPLVEALPRAGRSRVLAALVAASLVLVTTGWAMDLRASARHIRESHDLTLAPLGKWMADWRTSGNLLCDTPGTVPYFARWHTTAIAHDTRMAEAPEVVIVTVEGLFANQGDEKTDAHHGRAGRSLPHRGRYSPRLDPRPLAHYLRAPGYPGAHRFAGGIVTQRDWHRGAHQPVGACHNLQRSL